MIETKLKLLSFAKEIYNMKKIVRYSNALKIKDETVAEHSFFVSAFTLYLHNYYEFNLELALKIAIIHDLPEGILGIDIPHTITSKYENLKKIKKILETDALLKYPEYLKLFEIYEAKKTPEAKIVYVADILSCLQYSNEEIELGNKAYMQNVYKNAEVRLDIAMENIKKYAR